MRKILSGFFSEGFSTITAQVQQGIKKPTVFFLRDLPEFRRDVPWVEIDSTWVIVRKRSKEQGLLSVINKTMYVAKGKSSQCEPVDNVADFQMEVDQEEDIYYCIDVARANREVVCDRNLDQRLSSIDEKVYQQLNIKRRKLIYITQEEIISIRDNDSVDSIYMIQRADESFFGTRYTITYADILNFLLLKAKKEEVVEDNQLAIHERQVSVPIEVPVEEDGLEEAICDLELCNLCEGDQKAFFQETLYTSQDLRRSQNFIRYDCDDDLVYKNQIPLKYRKYGNNNKNRKMFGNKEGRDTNRYYDVADREKD
jgi:hypothetical protein